MHREELNDSLTKLLRSLSTWPEWKLNWFLLDESDLVVKRMVIEYKNQQYKMLTDYLNEKIDYSSIHYKVLPSCTDKKLIKTKGDFRYEKSK